MAARLRAAVVAALVFVAADLQVRPAAQDATFRANVAGVNLDVAVTRNGRPVRGLSARDFILTDSGVTQRVDTASLETLPLSVFLVLDTSGSVAGEKLASLVTASRALVGALRPGDRVSLVTFSDRVAVRVPLTTDAAAVAAALDTLTPGGQTALRDAAYSALQLLPADKSRPIVLIFSDGRDTASWLTSGDVLGAVRRAGVVIHAVELVEEDVVVREGDVLGGGPRPEPSSRFLGDLVASAGGRRWAASEPERLSDLFTDALNEMRSRYLLTYYPTSVDREGWHPLSVRLARGRADVTHRPGYQVGARQR
ncbi:MAG: VWA domain-containing protein [Vicinamibacterales bacterium]